MARRGDDQGTGGADGGFFDIEAEASRPRARPEPPARGAGRRRRRLGPGRGSAPDPADPGPAPRRARSGRSETAQRIAWAIPWIAFAIAIVVLGGLTFAAAMLGLAIVCQLEFFRMTRDSAPLTGVAVLVTAAMIALAHLGERPELLAVTLAAIPLMFLAVAVRSGVQGVTASFAITLMAIVWIGLPFAHAVLLREVPDHGLGLVVDVLVATFVADTAAYAGGRAIGRHQLAPRLSPNKTIEGLACGIAGGTAAFWFAGLYQDWLSGTDALILGFAVAVVAPIGDLFESVIKRDLGVKDSGDVIGPHGGLLDRLDSVLLSIVTGYWVAVALVV